MDRKTKLTKIEEQIYSAGMFSQVTLSLDVETKRGELVFTFFILLSAGCIFFERPKRGGKKRYSLLRYVALELESFCVKEIPTSCLVKVALTSLIGRNLWHWLIGYKQNDFFPITFLLIFPFYPPRLFESFEQIF
jgi:predicted small integral membrane protein